jgi:hypothetical protein
MRPKLDTTDAQVLEAWLDDADLTVKNAVPGFAVNGIAIETQVGRLPLPVLLVKKPRCADDRLMQGKQRIFVVANGATFSSSMKFIA